MKQEKSKTFPLEIKKGSVRVKVYRTVDRGRDRYTLGYHEGARRILRQFADLSEAKAEAAIVAERLNAGQGSALELRGSDRDAYLHAIYKLKPFKIGLVPAIDEYTSAKKWDVPLAVAARNYYDVHNAKLPDKSVPDAVEEFLSVKKADGRSVRYLQDCKARLERFSRDFKVNLNDVRTKEVDTWLRGLKLSPRTRNNFRTVISSLFSYARDVGYLVKNRPTEAEAVTVAKQDEGDIEVFTPAEFAKLLTEADDVLLPFLVFGGFAGLRSAEILRLKWEQVNWAEGVIEIQGKIAKTGTRRLPPLLPSAAAWLSAFKRAQGPVVGRIKLYRHLEKLSASVNIPWKQNGLRHSYCSYRMATLKDAPRVSYEAGNSVRIIQRHYDKVVAESQGKLWFSIMPKTAANIIQIESAA